MSENIKIRKSWLYVAIIIAVLIVAYAIYSSSTTENPIEVENNQTPVSNVTQEEVNSYKKAVYESIVCQYDCPTEDFDFQGTEQELLSQSCIDTCTTELKSKGFEEGQLKPEDVLDDNLFVDMDNLLRTCRDENVDGENIPDNAKFYECVKNNLRNLKSEYSYL